MAPFGGTVVMVGTVLAAATCNSYVPASYLIIARFIGLVPVLFIPSTARVPTAKINTGRMRRQ
jgi:MHS family proline/betaine transporter-like MFS transporter